MVSGLLLDTHVFLWWLWGDRRLSKRARTLIGDRDRRVFVSAASAWEITTKYRIGKLPNAKPIADDINTAIVSQAFSAIDISVLHAQRAGSMRGSHGDPFDRMLAAQAQLENLQLISGDALFDAFGVTRIW